jgi:hypothetical protein
MVVIHSLYHIIQCRKFVARNLLIQFTLWCTMNKKFTLWRKQVMQIITAFVWMGKLRMK